MSPASAERRSGWTITTPLNAATLARGLGSPLCDPEFHPRAAARHVERLWRAHGGRWHELDRVSALLAGVAQMAWRAVRLEGGPDEPPFSIAFVAAPRAVQVRLPERVGEFGVVLVWLRHFEALLPSGAPRCDLIFTARPLPQGSGGSADDARTAAPALDAAVWVWGLPPASLRP